MTDNIDALTVKKGKSAGPNGPFRGIWWLQALDPLQPIVHIFLHAIANCLLPLWNVNLYRW